MDSFTDPRSHHGSHRSPYHTPNPPDPFAAPVPGPDPVHGPGPAGAAVSATQVRTGHRWFLTGLAALVLAAATGIGGYALADGRLGPDDSAVQTAGPADGGSATDGAPDGAPDAGDGSGPADDATPGQDAADDAAGDRPAGGGTPVPGAAMTVEEANASVVRIEATGGFADPEIGVVEGVGSGSGFIISPDGVAVTNNHVVAGAAFLEVWLPGDDRPRNARILATSECSDLAVIDIDGGGFPQVALDMAPPIIGTSVYAAGYPLGDPEFTLTKGIVSKVETRGDTPFSSVDGVLEHDANINPGNSGGPLFGESGQVVGVNYQGDPRTGQSFAITSARARPIIDQLTAGVSVDSIGINGQVVDLGDRYGIFVSSVETGSMADEAGLVPGDVLLEIENVAVSTDGTMGDYCDVLRTNGTDVPLDITVLRPATDQLLFGTLNGGGLAVGFDGGEMMADAGMTAPDEAAPASEFQRIVDDTGVVSVEVPAEWTDIATGPITEARIANVSASTDLAGYVDTFDVGGLQLTAFDAGIYDFDRIWAARTELTDACAVVEPAEPLTIGPYTGSTLVAHECGMAGQASLLLFQVQAPDGDHFASGIVQVLTARDVEAAERALTTFTVA